MLGTGKLHTSLYSSIYHANINGHYGISNNSVNGKEKPNKSAKAYVNVDDLNITIQKQGQVSYKQNKLSYNAVPVQETILSSVYMLTKLKYAQDKKLH